MKLTIKIIAIVILAALSSPVFILNGCGKAINGGECGGCPDSTAPFGSTVTVTEPTLPPAVIGQLFCAGPVTFQFVNAGAPLNGICVEISVDGGAVLTNHTANPCSGAFASYLRERTNNSGVITVDLLVSSVTSSTTTYNVSANSCTVGTTWTASLAVQQ